MGYAEEKTSRDTYSASPIACALMKSSGAIYPHSTHVMHTGQPGSWSAVCLDAYPSSPYVRITSNYKQQNSLASGNGSKCSTVRIERPPNKTSETNKNSCGSGSKLVIAENPKSNKDSEKETSSRSFSMVLSMARTIHKVPCSPPKRQILSSVQALFIFQLLLLIHVVFWPRM